MIEIEVCECGHAREEHGELVCLGMCWVSPAWGEPLYPNPCWCLAFKLWYVDKGNE